MLGKNNKTNFEVFGEMVYRSYWLGEIFLDAFHETVEIIVRAKKDGPLASQFDAMHKFLATQDHIKQLATQQMFELHQQCGFKLDFHHDEKIWDVLTLIQIEVSDDQYYENDKDIAILIVFSSKLEQNFLPVIETKQGLFHEVLSGT